ncbi:MAG: DMT family transporter [Alphaproteobacteria bacterium]|nr:DMT family transporter [Alphaproteobacteria bacterium]MDP6256354.1 DMT family transporter [Alphaproteobacteria bacterium]MDP7054324.1 DMT family transporter [Alphaproteobacteria bacterium]MDP7230621.1 DMT family transporter [Alphaproteobacteria bacterium]MDP7459363.1 DMT family transporter [Alphaproteobacteria bacterium]
MFCNLSNGAKGALCMIIGGLLLTTQDGICKWLTAEFHPGEVMFYRGLFTFVPIIVIIAVRSGGIHQLATRNLKGTMIRAALGAGTSVFVVVSFIFLPLADALAIIFLSPIMLTALSGPMLGEPVGWRRWLAVFIGFAGVMLMIRPSAEGIPYYYFFPLLAALLSALRDVATRRLRNDDSSASILFYSMVAGLLAGAISMPMFGAHWPSPTQWGLFAAAGILNSLSHLLTIQALLLAPGGTMAPFRYLSLIWAAVMGYLIWGDVPDGWKLAGAALVVGAGLFILYREMRGRR